MICRCAKSNAYCALSASDSSGVGADTKRRSSGKIPLSSFLSIFDCACFFAASLFAESAVFALVKFASESFLHFDIETCAQGFVLDLVYDLSH